MTNLPGEAIDPNFNVNVDKSESDNILWVEGKNIILQTNQSCKKRSYKTIRTTPYVCIRSTGPECANIDNSENLIYFSVWSQPF